MRLGLLKNLTVLEFIIFQLILVIFHRFSVVLSRFKENIMFMF